MLYSFPALPHVTWSSIWPESQIPIADTSPSPPWPTFTGECHMPSTPSFKANQNVKKSCLCGRTTYDFYFSFISPLFCIFENFYNEYLTMREIYLKWNNSTFIPFTNLDHSFIFQDLLKLPVLQPITSFPFKNKFG